MWNKYGQIQAGWLEGCKQVLSPNCSARPTGTHIDLVVVHNISLPPGEFGGPHVEALFTNTLDPSVHPYFETIAHLQVSAHFLIRRDGDIVQFVATDQCAWHAGVSEWRGRPRCNDYSIGIELEGTDTQIYADAQYERLGELVQRCRDAYPTIEPSAIVGHSDIAPGRKTDPGACFDWHRLNRVAGVSDARPTDD